MVCDGSVMRPVSDSELMIELMALVWAVSLAVPSAFFAGIASAIAVVVPSKITDKFVS